MISMYTSLLHHVVLISFCVCTDDEERELALEVRQRCRKCLTFRLTISSRSSVPVERPKKQESLKQLQRKSDSKRRLQRKEVRLTCCFLLNSFMSLIVVLCGVYRQFEAATAGCKEGAARGTGWKGRGCGCRR